MANERDDTNAERAADDARNYSGNVINVPKGYDAADDLEHRLTGEAGTVTSYVDPWDSNPDWDRHVVVGDDGIDRIFLVNQDTGETLNVTDHPDHKPSETEDAKIAEGISESQQERRVAHQNRLKLAEVDDMLEEGMGLSEAIKAAAAREGGISLAEAMEAAKRSQEEDEEDKGPKNLSPGTSSATAEEWPTYFRPWEYEGMTEEELKQIGAHPDDLKETLPAVDETYVSTKEQSKMSNEPKVGETTETEAAKMAASGLFELPSVKMGETYAWKRAQLMAQGTPPTDDQLTSLANLRTIWLRQLDRESAQAGGLGVSQELSASEAVAKDPVDSALMASMSEPEFKARFGMSEDEFAARHRADLKASGRYVGSSMQRVYDSPYRRKKDAERAEALREQRLMEERAELYGPGARGEFTRGTPAPSAGQYKESKTME
tara:strand:- start:1718 stop:3019 length:1302 start_codon:yes stop_codon:yes gene_type:complete